MCPRPGQIFFWKTGTNSTVKFGPNPAWRPIFSQFGCRLTTPPKLRSWPFLRLFRLKWPTSELRRRGQTTSEMAENCCPVTFWPKLHRRVWGVIPNKIWPGLICSAMAKFWYEAVFKVVSLFIWPQSIVETYCFSSKGVCNLYPYFCQTTVGSALIFCSDSNSPSPLLTATVKRIYSKEVLCFALLQEFKSCVAL